MHALSDKKAFPLPDLLSAKLETALEQTAIAHPAAVFAAGGVVRDLVLHREIRDLDLVVHPEPIGFAALLADRLGVPMFVLDEKEQVARIVWDCEIDVSGFRAASETIEEDLRCRDFTINAMAVALPLQKEKVDRSLPLIDPFGGLADLEASLIRVVTPRSFADDPLRLLRAYRFAATLQFALDAETASLLALEKGRIRESAPERIKYEMELMFSASKSGNVLRQMQKSGLLFELFPLLRNMEGVRQPLSHHLDVLDHSLATLSWMEEVLEEPGRYFPESQSVSDYLQDRRKKVLLKWAALFHDCGKPASRAELNDRITFYHHDRSGAALFEKTAAHYRWSRKDSQLVSSFISSHMWPFHLNNVFRQQRISKRACLRLAKKLGNELPGLFLLAMADSLAGEGPEKPPGMEASLAALYHAIETVYQQVVAQQMTSPPLVNGHDLIERFGLSPGPVFKEILGRIRDAQLCGELEDREHALRQVERILASTEILTKFNKGID